MLDGVSLQAVGVKGESGEILRADHGSARQCGESRISRAIFRETTTYLDTDPTASL